MLLFFFVKQKTAYEMRISDLSSDVCSSDLRYSFFCSLSGSCLTAGRNSARKSFSKVLILAYRWSTFSSLNVPSLKIFRTASRAVDCGGASCGVSGVIGRASCRERVGQYVSIAVVHVTYNTK